MSDKYVFQDILDIMDEIKTIVDNTNWRTYSKTRVGILITQKLDALKHIQSEIPDEAVYLRKSTEATNFFEKFLSRINDIMNNMSQDDLILQWYELELFRLSYASRYANTYGHGGELQVAGTAQALANALIGIETLDVKNLMVDWDHPEFSKRRKLILNYLNSAYTFFF
ncbi:MAG: hypothetical protein KAS95_09910, partial [Candidatus Heimdallarchaeota archaeon]|nr:hypothetical protein [Candidatus Heimdallarchaeota archaeon]